MSETIQALEAQHAELTLKLLDAKADAKLTAVLAVKELMAQHGMTLHDVADKPFAVKSVRAKVAVQYRDANGNTWTGRGQTPTWMVSAIAGGATREQFRIAA